MGILNESKLHLRLDEIPGTNDAPVMNDIPDTPDSSGIVFDAPTAVNIRLPLIMHDSNFGDCMKFDGLDDVLELPAQNLGLQNSSFTITLWFRISKGAMDVKGEPGERALLRVETGHTLEQVLLSVRDGKLKAGTTSESLNGEISLLSEHWYHVAWCYDKEKQIQRLFVDGLIDAQLNNTLLSLQSSLLLGSAVEEKYFQGSLAQLRIYNSVLSQTHINQVRLQDKVGLLLHAPLDDITVDSASRLSMFADQSGNETPIFCQGAQRVVAESVFGACADFSGKSAEPVLINSPLLDQAMELTLMAWVFPTAKSVHQGIFQHRNETVPGSFHGLSFSGNNPSLPLALWIKDLEFQAAENSVPIGEWSHITAVWQSGVSVRLYVNGVLSRNESYFPAPPLGPLTVANTWSLGQDPGYGDERAFQGKIAHLRVYGRALNELQVNHIMQNDLEGVSLHVQGAAVTTDNRVLDLSGNGRMAKIIGTPQVSVDSIFGSCLAFDGTQDGLELADAASVELSLRSFTLETCFQFFQTDSASGQAIVSTDAVADTKGLQLIIKDNKIYVAYDTVELAGVRSIKPGQWYHLVLGYDKSNGELRLYIDGVMDAAKVDVAPFTGQETLRIGSQNGGAFFNGKMAYFKVYKRALGAQKVLQRMRESLASRDAFQQLNPIWFNIYDEGIQNSLFINEANRESEILLEIGNNATHQLKLNSIPAAQTGPDPYHFELRFRPGVLDESTDTEGKTLLDNLHLEPAETVGWSYKVVKNQQSQMTRGSVSLYLFYNAADPLVLAPGEKVTLPIQGLALATRGGTRGTRLELNYCNLQFASTIPGVSTTAKSPLLSGSREIHLSLVNRRGERNVPLHIGFFGGNRIINDGITANELTLNVTVTDLNRAVDYSPSITDTPSTFTLYFESQLQGEQQPWALGTSDEVSNIDIETEGMWKCTKNIIAQGPVWTIASQTKTKLEPAEVIKITIGNIISSLPCGLANLVFKTRNIPGYRDGEFKIPIEKSPLVTGNQWVGIGTSDPKANLHVNGNITKLGGHFQNTTLRIEATDTAGAPAATVKLELHGYENRAKGIYISDENASNKWFVGEGYGYNGGFGIGFSTGNETEYSKNAKFFVNKNGDVGVGTTDPKSKLDVKGMIHVDKLKIRQPESWATPRLSYGWSNIAGNNACGYYKDELGIVHLRGFLLIDFIPVKDPDSFDDSRPFPHTIFNLKRDCRPENTEVFSTFILTPQKTSTEIVYVKENGDVYFPSTKTGSISLDGITFRAK